MLTSDEKQFYDENGYVLKHGLASSEEIEKVQAEIHDIHSRMAKQSIDGVEVAWEQFDDPNTPPRIKQLMQSEPDQSNPEQDLTFRRNAGYYRATDWSRHLTVS